MDRPLLDGSVEPDEQSLQAALGATFVGYRSVLDLADAFARDWSFGKSGGWMLQIHDHKKALLYVIPLRGSFRVSMAIRETERDAFLGDDDLVALRGRIEAAARSAEGFVLRFDIASQTDLDPVRLLIGKLIGARA